MARTKGSTTRLDEINKELSGILKKVEKVNEINPEYKITFFNRI